MKTILCPVDFSPRCDRLLQYIGELAHDRNGKVFLISTQTAAKKELVMTGAPSGYSRIDKMHDYLSGIQRVPCGIIQETLTGSSASKKLGAFADNYDIMAVSMPSSVDANENDKGLELQKIINDTLAPILVVPDRFPYRKIKRMLYAYDYKHEPDVPLMPLHWLSDWFDAEVLFITLFPGETSIKEQEKLLIMQDRIKNSWKGNRPISFRTVMYPNVPKGLEHYLELSEENDLLVLSVNHQNIFERVWHKSVIKGVIHISRHPYLIIHR